MRFGGAHRIDLRGVLVLAALSVFALFVALVGVPWIARATGADVSTVIYVVCGICAAIYIAGVVQSARKKVGVK
jgi:hypothetical protein